MGKGAQIPFVASIFLSAFLLFLIQPLVTQMLLPYFGGSPAVWNTALVFFQVLLLLGYLYAHALTHLDSWKWVLPIHLTFLAGPLLLLPPAVPDELLQQGAMALPMLAVLAALSVSVGFPFFVLSTNSSLVQYWWSRTGCRGSEDPYWLYGASNTGSLLALLSYPFLVAPILGIRWQASLWAIGYVAFALLTAGALALAIRSPARPSKVTERPVKSLGSAKGVGGDPEPGSATEPLPDRWENPHLTKRRVFLWIARAAVASSLLLSITMRISMDVGSVPLLWVVPLSAYLLTFILAFSFSETLGTAWIESGAVLTLCLSLGLLLAPGVLPYPATVLAALGTLFFGALYCHVQLARDRPAAKHLTFFYLWVSVGGALGGILNSLIAPILFDSVAEYPLTLVALALLFHAWPEGRYGLRSYRPSNRLGLLAAGTLLAPLALRFSSAVPDWGWFLFALGGVLMGLGLARYVGSVVAISIIAAVLHFGGQPGGGSMVVQKRSFFGVVRVVQKGEVRTMSHGTTVHGMQNLSTDLRRTPLSYYHPEGPLGSAVASLRPSGRVGVVGLGTGALAALLDPDQEIVFHEIDPLVVEVAREYFTYLVDSPGSVRIVLGDGRLTLAQMPDGCYDLLILDAYSSDFIPIHLLTTQALEVYRSKITEQGLILLHLSNRYADLARVLKGASAAMGTPIRMKNFVPSERAEAEGAVGSRVAAMAREEAVLGSLGADEGWFPVSDLHSEAVVWTDSKASLFSVLW